MTSVILAIVVCVAVATSLGRPGRRRVSRQRIASRRHRPVPRTVRIVLRLAAVGLGGAVLMVLSGQAANAEDADPVVPATVATTAAEPTTQGAGTAEAGPAEAPPAEKAEAAPVEQTETAPAAKTEAAPAEKTEAAPAEKTETAPAEKTETAPVEQTETAPVEQTEAAPAVKTETTPVEQTEVAATPGEATATGNPESPAGSPTSSAAHPAPEIAPAPAVQADSPAVEANPQPDARGEWALDLTGAQTLSADADRVYLRDDGALSGGASGLLSQIRTIVVRGSNGQVNTLSVLGVSRPVSFSGNGSDRLVLVTPEATVTLVGDGSGTAEAGDGSGSVTFTGVAEVAGTGATRYTVRGQSGLQTLTLDADDSLDVDAATARLTSRTANLGGTLHVTGSPETGAGQGFLTFDHTTGDFASFRGLDRGHGAYLKPELDATGYRLTPSALPDDVTVTLPTAADADDFFAFVSGKSTPVAAGTPVTIGMRGQELSGSLTLGRSADATTLDLSDAVLQLGPSDAPVATITGTGPAHLTLTPTNLSGTVTGTLRVATPGVSVDGPFDVAVDSAAGTTATGHDVTLRVGDQQVSGVPLTVTYRPGGQLHLTAPAGATLTLGGGTDPLLSARLLGALDLVLTPSGMTGTLPTATVASSVPGVTVDGTYQLVVGPTGALGLHADRGGLTAGDTHLTGDLTLAPAVTQTGESVVTAAFGPLDVRLLGGLLVVLGLAAGSFALLRSGLVGGASGSGGHVETNGITGTADVTMGLNTADLDGDVTLLVDGRLRTISGRGPPLEVDLSDLRTTLSTTPVSTSITSAAQLPGSIAGLAPTAWQIALTPDTDHTVVVDATPDALVVTVDGVASARSLALVTGLTVTGANRNDTLHLLASPVTLTFDGGAGTDAITGPAADTVWHVTGAGAGSVDALTFTGVEELVGAAGNRDVFAFTAGGSLLLGVDGGAGGFDTLRYDGPAGSSLSSVGYAPSGLDSGTVTFGGTPVRFAGLEPVSNNVTSTDVTVTYTDPTDQLTVSTDGTTGHIVISATKSEQFDFVIPTGSVTINAGGAQVTFATVNVGSATLTVNNAGQIVVGADLTAAAISLTALANITIADGVEVQATAGDLALVVKAEVSATWTAGAVPIFRDLQASGSLTIGAAHLSGDNVTLTVEATTAKFAIFDISSLDLDSQSTALTATMRVGAFPTFTPGASPGNPGTITRLTGSWLDDGFTAGTDIRVTDSASNDGFYHVTNVTSTTLTVAPVPALTQEAGDDAVLIEEVHLVSGAPALTFSGATITRSSGSWVLDGFVAGQQASILGTPDGNGDGDPDNDGQLLIVSVTDTTLTLDVGNAPFAAQSGVTGATVFSQGNPAAIPLTEADPNVSMQDETIGLAFADTGQGTGTITRSTGSWTTNGFAAGQLVVVGDGSANSGSYWVVGVAGAVLTVLTPKAFVGETGRTGVEVAGTAYLNDQTPDADAPALQLSGNTVTRTSGSWVAEGFAVGQAVNVYGTTYSDGTYRVAAVSDGILTLVGIDGSTVTFTAENTAGATTDVDVTTAVTLQHPVLTFTGSTVSRDRGSWTTDGFTVGDRIRVSGDGVLNASQFVIAAVSADGRTLTLAINPGTALDPEVTVTAEVQRLLTPSEMGSPQGPVSSGDVAAGLEQQLDTSSGYAAFVDYFAQVVKASATSVLTIADGAVVIAAHTLTVTSTATSRLVVAVPGVVLAVSYAESDASAQLTIGAAQLSAGGDVTIASIVDNTLDQSVTIVDRMLGISLKQAFPNASKVFTGPGLLVAIGQADSSSTTTVNANALVTGAAVTITATNTNSFSTKATRPGKGVHTENTGLGIAIAVADYHSTATVTVAGTVRGTSSVDIESTTTAKKDAVSASASIGAAPRKPAWKGIASGIFSHQVDPDLFDRFLGVKELDPAANPSTVAAAAAVAVHTSSNHAVTELVGTAVVSSRGALTVASDAEDKLETVATASSTLNDTRAKAGTTAAYSAAGGVAVTNLGNTASTTVDDGAVLNAAGATTVEATALLPLRLNILDVIKSILEGPLDKVVMRNPRSDDSTQNGKDVKSGVDGELSDAKSRFGDVKHSLKDILTLVKAFNSLPVMVATSMAATHSGSQLTRKTQDGKTAELDRSQLAVSGTVVMLTVDNEAAAVVGAASVNTTADPGFAVTADDDQSVTVAADATAYVILISGISKRKDLAFFASSIDTRGKVGLGGNYQGLQVTNRADAHIARGAVVVAHGDVIVASTGERVLVTISQISGDATKVGITGAFTLIRSDGSSLAYIEDGAHVAAGGDLAVQATNYLVAVAVSAVFQSGGVVSVGVGASINAVSSTTRAFVGRVDGDRAAADSGTQVSAGGDLTVVAGSQTILVAVGTAARQPSAGGDASAAGAQRPDDVVAWNEVQTVNPTATRTAYGFGLSGHVGVNFVADTTEASVDVPGAMTVGGSLIIDAHTTTWVSGYALAVFKGEVGGATLAGAFVWNELSGRSWDDPSTSGTRRTTSAWLAAATVTARDVSVTATTDEHVYAVAAGLGNALPTSGSTTGDPVQVNVAGSAVVTHILTETTAQILAQTSVTTPGDVTVRALRALTIYTVAGVVVIDGTAAVGASVVADIVDDVVHATVGQGAQVTAGGNVSVVADEAQQVIAVAVAGAAFSDRLALPVSVNVQLLTADVRATLQPGVAITAGGHVAVDAILTASTFVIAGSGAFASDGSGLSAGVGVAVALVEATRTVAALVDDGSTINQGANVNATTPDLSVTATRSVHGMDVYAQAGDLVVAVAASGAGSQTGSGLAGDAALTPAVILLTTTASSNTVNANLSGTAVSVAALSSPTLYSVGVAGSVAISSGTSGGGAGGGGPPAVPSSASAHLALAGAAAGAVNIIGGTQEFSGATAEAVVTGGSITSTGDVIVSATGSSYVTADAGGLAIALSTGSGSVAGSFGISFAANEIASKITARISGATVDASGGMQVLATATPVVFALTLAGSLAIGTSSSNTSTSISVAGAGAGSRNAIDLQVAATLDQVTATVDGSVTVSASSAATIRADAGGFAVSAAVPSASGSVTNIALGLSAAVDEISGSVQAAITGSGVTAGGDIVVEALSDGTISALSMGGALGGAGAGSGAASLNMIALHLDAEVEHSTVASTGGLVEVEAGDTSTIKADAGGVSIALSFNLDPRTLNPGLAVGASAAVNQIRNSSTASVTSSTVTASGDVSILATATPSITALTLSGTAAVQQTSWASGVSVALAGAAAGSGNAVDDMVFAMVTDSTITAGGDVTVTAQMPAGANGTIDSRAYGATFSLELGTPDVGVNVAVGGAVAVNAIGTHGGNQVNAWVQQSSLIAGHDVTVRGEVDPTISTTAVGVAAGVSFADAGTSTESITVSIGAAVTMNQIANAIDTHVTDSTVCAGADSTHTSCLGTVTVAAAQHGSVTATVLAASLGGSFSRGATIAIGASAATSDLGSTVEAEVSGSSTRISGGTVAITSASDNPVRMQVGAASLTLSLSGTGATLDISGAGAAAVTTVQDVVLASVDGAVVTAGLGGIVVEASAGSSDRDVKSQAVAASLTLTASGDGASVSGSVDAAVSDVKLENVASAEVVDGAALVADGAVHVLAGDQGAVDNQAGVAALDVNLSFSSPAVTVALAAAVSRTTVTHEVEVLLLHSDVTGRSVTIGAQAFVLVFGRAVALTLSATVSVSAGFDVGGTGAGAVATTDVGGTVAATVDGSTVTATDGDLSVTAQTGADPQHPSTTQTAQAVAVGVAVSVTGTGAAVTVNVDAASASNTLDTATTVSVDPGSDLCAGWRDSMGACTGAPPVTISATRTAALVADSSGGSLSVGAGATSAGVDVGVALASNTVAGSTTATVSGSAVVGGSVQVTATDNVDVDASTLALGLSLNLSDAGSVNVTVAAARSVNTAGAVVTVQVSSAQLRADVDDITVGAFGNSSLTATTKAGAVSASNAGNGLSLAVSVGLAQASNTLTDAVQTSVDGSTLDAAGRILVSARSGQVDATTARMVAHATAIAISEALTDPVSGISVSVAATGTSVVNTAGGGVKVSIVDGSALTARSAGTDPAVSISAGDATTTSTTATTSDNALSDEAAVAIGASLVETDLSTNVLAEVDASTLDAPNAGVEVIANRTAVADSRTDVTSIAIGISGALASAETRANVAGSATAQVVDGSVISSGGALNLAATTAARAEAVTTGGSGSVLVSVSALWATAQTSATTSATIDASTVTAGGVSVSATRTGVPDQTGSATITLPTTSATVSMTAVSVVAAGAGARALANDTGDVTARIGTGSSIDAGVDAVTVTASSTTMTQATPKGFAAALGAALIVPLASATHFGATTASVGPDAGVSAGWLSVTASGVSTVVATVSSTALALGGGGGFSDAEALEAGDVQAYIGTPIGTTAPTNARHVDVSAAVSVLALVHQTAQVTLGGDEIAGLIGIGGQMASATNSATHRAYLGDGTWLAAGSLQVAVQDLDGAGALRSATAATVTASLGGVVAVNVTGSSATITGSLEAFIGAGAAITVTGATSVTALGAATATATAKGGAGSIFNAAAAFNATARIVSTDDTRIGTRAWVGAGTSLTTGTLTVQANASDQATATLFVLSVAIRAADGGKAEATVVSDVSAYVGAPASSSTTVVSATGEVDVLATGSQLATATGSGGSGGVVTLGWLKVFATIGSRTDAFVGDGVTVSRADSLQVRAESVNAGATSKATIDFGGGIAFDGVTSTASSTPSVSAYLGDGVHVGSVATPVGTDVVIAAVGRAEADATGRAYGGGGIDVAPPRASVTITPTVDAHIGTSAATGTSVVAQGTISLTAVLNRGGSGSSDTIASASASADQLSFDFPAPRAGAQVLFSMGNVSIGGLHDGSEYTVVSVDGGLIRLGSLFDAANVDPSRETITFAVRHGYTSGDCVWYDAQGGTSIIGATRGSSASGCGAGTPPVPGARAFFVRVVDPTTIQLTTSYAAATASSDATIEVTPSTPTTVTPPSGILSATLKAGDLVVYRAPVSVSFLNSAVNVDLVTIPQDEDDPDSPSIVTFATNPDGSTAHNQQQNNIFLGQDAYNALNTGDAVHYVVRGDDETNSIGLASGTTFYVIKTGDGYTIRLAYSYCAAVGEQGDPSCTGQSVVALQLTVGTDDGVTHQLDRSLGQLVDGHTYYVTHVEANGDIGLSDTRGGQDISLIGTNRPGPHRLGLVEVDLVAGGTGQQALFVDLTTDCDYTCGQLHAPSGEPLATTEPLVGDGISSATATGGTRGVADFAFPSASLSGSPSVSATVAATVVAGRSVVVTATSQLSTTSTADTNGGGAISVGSASSQVDLSERVPTILTLDGSISAGRDIYAEATVDHYMSSSARSHGGGVVAKKSAQSHAYINDDVTTSVAAGAVLTAGGTLSLLANATNTGSDTADAYAPSAAGSGAYANNSGDRGIRVGSSTQAVERTVDIGAGARISAAAVTLYAHVSPVTLTSSAKATAYGAAGVVAYARPSVDIYSDTSVRIHGGNTVITGLVGVEILARQDTLSITRTGKVLGIATVPVQHLYLEGKDSFTTRVDVESGVTVTAGAQVVGDPAVDGSAAYAVDIVATNAEPNRKLDHHGIWSNKTSQASSGDILWDADIVVLAGAGGPVQLVIGADGMVLASNGVLVNGTAPTVGSPLPAGVITLAPVYAGALVNFAAHDTIANHSSDPSTWPVFEFRTTVDSVAIVNQSDAPLVIGDLDVRSTTGTVQPRVWLSPNDGNESDFKTKATIEFHVSYSSGPTDVDIEQRAATAQDLVVQGTITNPLGTTRLVNASGSITGSGLVVTRGLDVSALSGSVGSSAAPLTVDLVRYTDSSGTVQIPGLFVAASGDVWISLRGVDRSGSTSPMIVYVDSVVTGGHVDLTLRTAVSQTLDSTSGPAVYVTVWAERSQWGTSAPTGIPHTSRFRGENSTDRSAYDPPSDQVASALDPASPTGDETEIDSTVQFGPGLGVVGTTANGITLHDVAGSSARLSVIGAIDPDAAHLPGYGRLTVEVSGDVDLVVAGNVALGKVESRTGDVSLRAGGAIADDGDADDGVDVAGVEITLSAQRIGTPDDFVEIDLRNDQPRQGGLTASAVSSLFVMGVGGDLRVRTVTVGSGDATLPNDVTLYATDGSILDLDQDAAADVIGNRVVLVAHRGTVGTEGDALEVDTSIAGWRRGFLYASGDAGVYVTETKGELVVLGAVAALSGSVQLSTVDTATADSGTDTRGVAYQYDSIELLSSGQVVLAPNSTVSVGPSSSTPSGVRAALGDVVISSGDDVRAGAGTSVYAGGSVTISVDAGNADPGRGAYTYLAGSLTAAGQAPDGVVISGGSDADLIVLDSTTLGSRTAVEGGAGDDAIEVTTLQTMPSGATLFLDGGFGSDTYFVTTTGSGGDARAYDIRVSDSGLAVGDRLQVLGTDSSDDVFVVRPASVVLLPSATAASCGACLQRVDYDDTVDELDVIGGGGNDTFVVDGTSVAVSLLGGAGTDTFVVGQLYGNQRDDIGTTQTTQGYVSGGTLGALTLDGGDDADVFTINGNGGAVQVLGGAGGDLVTVRALRLVGGGYLAHAPITVDGGSDSDQLAVLGTESPDAFFVGTVDGQPLVAGAGVTVQAANTESVELDAQDGADYVFVGATAAGVNTRVVGGKGSDQFTIAGDVTVSVTGATLTDTPFTTPTVAHSLSNLLGPLAVEGDESGAMHAIPAAVLLPGETDNALPAAPAAPTETQPTDLLDIHDDGYASGHLATLTATSLTWGGSGSATYSDVEILLLFLGAGEDQVSVMGTPTRASAIHGGGGKDLVTVSGAAPGSLLVVYGDTDASGQFYTGRPVNLHTPTSHTFPISGSVPFTNPSGNDIDASKLSDATVMFIAAGGSGTDDIYGGSGNDLIAGGAGDDYLYGNGGNDVILGDDVLSVDIFTGAVTFSCVTPGADTLDGGAGDDVLIGDCGTQVPGGWKDDSGTGGNDTIHGGDGNDWIIGGGGNDQIDGGNGDDVILGDDGQITTSGATSSDAVSGDDSITSGAGNDVVFGGPGTDRIDTGTGADTTLGNDVAYTALPASSAGTAGSAAPPAGASASGSSGASGSSSSSDGTDVLPAPPSIDTSAMLLLGPILVWLSLLLLGGYWNRRRRRHHQQAGAVAGSRP